MCWRLWWNLVIFMLYCSSIQMVFLNIDLFHCVIIWLDHRNRNRLLHRLIITPLLQTQQNRLRSDGDWSNKIIIAKYFCFSRMSSGWRRAVPSSRRWYSTMEVQFLHSDRRTMNVELQSSMSGLPFCLNPSCERRGPAAVGPFKLTIAFVKLLVKLHKHSSPK